MLITFEPDEHVFNTLFAQQLGDMPKYRGSPMAGGAFGEEFLGLPEVSLQKLRET